MPIWSVPFPRNPFFTGRKDVLDQLHELLQGIKTTSLSQPLAMSGLGGIGKTQTAVEYAYRFKDQYKVVCWIKSSTSEELAADFASLAQLLNLAEQSAQEQSHIIAAVKSWFETNTGWLLIFDNADELATITDYLPKSNTGHILITTRAHAMSGIATKIEMHMMNREEGTHLLLQRAGLSIQTTPLDQVSEADLSLAYRIIDELGGLPLALDQAGAYLEETGEDLATYLMLFDEQRTELLHRRGGLHSDHAPVATTWTLALQNIEDSNPAAIELIRLYSFLAPDEIPEELLGESADLLSSVLQPLAKNQALFNNAIMVLLKYSLIQRDRISKTMSIHRLVQAVIQDDMNKTLRERWAEQIVGIVSHLFPFDEVAPWRRSQRYLSQALLAVEYIRRWSFTIDGARSLLHSLGIYFYSRGQYNEAEPLLQRFRAISEISLGSNNVETTSSLYSLAILFSDQGKYEQAEPLYQRALAICEQQLGPNHPNTASSLNNLATIYTNQGRYEQAEPLYQRALAIFDTQLGPNHPDTATSLNDLAFLYYEKGEYEQAEPLYQRALAIRERILGPDHPDTASSLNNLGLFYDRQGKYEQAEPLYQRALAIREQQLGPNHPDTTTVQKNYSNLLEKIKNKQK